MSDMSSALGARIRELRLAKGYTIESFAHELGYSWITVSRYERGKSTPDITRLHHIADALGVTASELLGQAA